MFVLSHWPSLIGNKIRYVYEYYEQVNAWRKSISWIWYPNKVGVVLLLQTFTLCNVLISWCWIPKNCFLVYVGMSFADYFIFIGCSCVTKYEQTHALFLLVVSWSCGWFRKLSKSLSDFANNEKDMMTKVSRHFDFWPPLRLSIFVVVGLSSYRLR